jgi:hypothetical protein
MEYLILEAAGGRNFTVNEQMSKTNLKIKIQCLEGSFGRLIFPPMKMVEC